jgi:plastocyanin
MKLRGTIARAIGLVAAFSTAAFASFALLAASASAIGITITLATCAGGGTEFCFSPEDAAAQTGAQVTWTDQSGVGHQIAPCTPIVCPGSPASTGHDTFNVFVPANGHGSFTFTSAGTYYYYCTIHGYAAMHGSITVTASATPPPSPSPTPHPTARPTPRTTQRPSMKPANPTPKSGHTASPPPIATQRATPSPTAVGTPNVGPLVGSTPPIPTPSPQDVAVVTSTGGLALPIAIVVAILLAATAAGYLAFRSSRRQAG